MRFRRYHQQEVGDVPPRTEERDQGCICDLGVIIPQFIVEAVSVNKIVQSRVTCIERRPRTEHKGTWA